MNRPRGSANVRETGAASAGMWSQLGEALFSLFVSPIMMMALTVITDAVKGRWSAIPSGLLEDLISGTGGVLFLVVLGILFGVVLGISLPWSKLLRSSGVVPLKFMQFAVLVAGRRRATLLREEWHAHLSGEAGHGLTGRQQLRAACGFLRAGVCYRVQDAADLWWKLGDRVLASRAWSNAVVWLPTLFAVSLVIRRDGVFGVVENFENLASLCGSLFLAIRFGRKWRGVKPPKHESKRGNETSR